ncbi:MAG TPA: DUF3305 domain-containing protein [Casimicrobiaceae bacterium]|jgi:hypothetical protein
MQAARIPVDVVMERVPLQSFWASERWQPAAVVASDALAAQPSACERLQDYGDRARWRCGGFEIELHPTEVEGYLLNLTSPDPKAFVLWRLFDDGEPPARPVIVTVSYNEAGRFLDAGEQVDGVPLPEPVAQWMRVFVARHYKPEPRRKGRRDDRRAGTEGGPDRD